jgi:Tol biopolymer transport system component
MHLSPGYKLGPYEILAPIGAGGMGEVYKAHDARLNRTVAVKILPESFARDPERMRRFEQEARAVAALSHPNVVAVFDTGAHDGLPYLVSELLEGQTLRDLLNSGPVPARKSVEYASQIAGGLAAAHEKAMVHRDIKPENIFIGTDGRAKILDFGLAKMTAPQSASSPADGATQTIASSTNPGVIMGTTGYMSPEQVRGASVDHRSDIFSFGATLYEMLSGHRAFKGDTSVETMNSILKEDPPQLDEEKLHVSPGLERIIRHCLEKNPAERFQSARDLTFALGALSGTSSDSAIRSVAASRFKMLPWALGALGALLIAAVAYLALHQGASLERAEFAIPVLGEVSNIALSPDGHWLAFVSPGGDQSTPMVYVQRIGTTSARAITGSEGASFPFWSPDSNYVAFFAGFHLKKAAISGGDPQNIAVAAVARGGAWGSKNVIVYAPDSGGALWRVNADGTGAAPLTDKLLLPSEDTHRWPVFLPDGDHFLFWAGNFSTSDSADTNGIFLGSLDAKERTKIVTARSSIGFSAGQIFYVDSNGALRAAQFDLGAKKTSGDPLIINNRVAVSPSTYYALFTVSSSGTVIYSSTSEADNSQFTWFDATGKELGRVGSVGVMFNPAISRDEKRLAFDGADSKARSINIRLLDLASGSASRFTFDPTEETAPAWSPDGSFIAFRELNPPRIMLKKSSGLEADHMLAQSKVEADDMLPNSWAPDGKTILIVNQLGKGGSDLLVVSADTGQFRKLHETSASETNGQISPDGKWVSYTSNESGDWEIYVSTYPDGAGKWQISQGGGTEPRWRGDGKAIFFVGPKYMLMSANVSTAGSVTSSPPQPLFRMRARPPISSTDLFSYDVSRDGKRFLVNQYVKPDHVPPLSIVLNATQPASK